MKEYLGSFNALTWMTKKSMTFTYWEAEYYHYLDSVHLEGCSCRLFACSIIRCMRDAVR